MFFILIDKDKFVGFLELLIPVKIIEKTKFQKTNLMHMVKIQIVLCGVLDILPYVGTIIVFIPIIIYNIIMKKFLIAFGLICLYLLVQVLREILEAKFLSSKLEIHPLVILLSLYIGINLFGILGIVIGPMYSILAKEIIYS